MTVLSLWHQMGSEHFFPWRACYYTDIMFQFSQHHAFLSSMSSVDYHTQSQFNGESRAKSVPLSRPIHEFKRYSLPCYGFYLQCVCSHLFAITIIWSHFYLGQDLSLFLLSFLCMLEYVFATNLKQIPFDILTKSYYVL